MLENRDSQTRAGPVTSARSGSKGAIHSASSRLKTICPLDRNLTPLALSSMTLISFVSRSIL